MKKKKRGRKKKINTRDKVLRVIMITCIICGIILFFECVFLLYKNYFLESKVSYFDGINDFCYKDNNYIAVGSNNDNDKKLEKAKIVKYDDRKEKIWEYIYNKGYNGTFLAVDIDRDNNIIAVGSYESDKNENEDSLRTALLVKYDEDGKMLFEKKFQLLGNSKFTSIKSIDDGYIVGGQSIYNDMTVGNKKGGAFLIKYDKEGKIIWKSNYGNSKTAVYNDLVIYKDNIYAVGKDSDNVGVVSKYNMSGKLIKSIKYNDVDDLGFTGITISSNDIVVSGSVNNSNDTDALLVKYDLDCNYVDKVIHMSDEDERYNKVITDKDNNLIVVGIKSTNIKNSKYGYEGIIGKYKNDLKEINVLNYSDNKDDYFTQVKLVDSDYVVSGYSSYQDDGYLSKFITYSDALKVLEVK